MDSVDEIGDSGCMQHLTIPRVLLFACALLPACGDDKGDSDSSTNATMTSNATPGTATDGSATDGSATDVGTESSPTTTNGPTTTPTGTDPTVTATGSGTDPTTDPTAGDGMFCQEQCAADGDCALKGTDIVYKCTDGRCVGGCADDIACVELFSQWIMDCASQGECPEQVCIDIGGGVGKCATEPSDFVMCETFMQEEVMFPPIEGGEPLTVCANTSYECKDGNCINPCESDQECTLIPGQSQCNLDTGACTCADDAGCMAANPMTPKCTDAGFCGCAEDANCAGSPNTPVCTDSGFCGCAEDANCTAAMTGDTCYNGSCGCSDASACPAVTTFDGTMYVCEGL